MSSAGGDRALQNALNKAKKEANADKLAAASIEAKAASSSTNTNIDDLKVDEIDAPPAAPALSKRQSTIGRLWQSIPLFQEKESSTNSLPSSTANTSSMPKKRDSRSKLSSNSNTNLKHLSCFPPDLTVYPSAPCDSPIVKAGWLYKLSMRRTVAKIFPNIGRHFKNWKKRWFILHENGEIYY